MPFHDLTTKYGINEDMLARYERAGVLKPIHVDGSTFYEGLELRLSVISKAQAMGFEFEEIVALLRMSTG